MRAGNSNCSFENAACHPVTLHLIEWINVALVGRFYIGLMKPATSTLSSAEANFRRNERISFGPYLAFEAVPWLLLATVIRIYSRALPDSLLLLGFLAVHVPVFVAFLLASQRMIDLSGGSTSLERLPFTYQLSLSWAVIWRLFILFVATIIGAVSFGMDKNLAARFWVGFDGIVFAWGWGFLPFWSALVATIVFVMIVEKGLNRKPTFLSVLRQFRARWKYLTQATAIIGLLFFACNFAQLFAGKLVLALGEQLGHPLGRNLLYIGFFVGLSYVRLWLAITILTYALRASYREQSLRR